MQTVVRPTQIDGYFRYLRTSQWHPRTLLQDCTVEPLDPTSEVGAHVLRMCDLGAANEADAYEIAVAASNDADIAADPLWRLFAPFWLRDEAQHAEAFHRMLVAMGAATAASWPDRMLGEIAAHQPHRDRFYASSPVFTDRVWFWAALAIDEWNTAREYAASARHTFRQAGSALSTVMARIAADEVQHHEYAVGALIAIGQDPSGRPAIACALERTAAWAQAHNGTAMDQFVFDQDPVPGSSYVPDYPGAAADTWRKCEAAWSRGGW